MKKILLILIAIILVETIHELSLRELYAQNPIKITVIQGEKFAVNQGKEFGIATGQYYDIFRENNKIGTAQVIALRETKSVFKIIDSNDMIEVGDELRLNKTYAGKQNDRQSFFAIGVIFSAVGIAVFADNLQSQDYAMTSRNAGKLAGSSALTMAGLIMISKGIQK